MTEFMAIEAVIFDRDGVLIDSEGANVLAATEALAHFGANISDEEKQYIVGKPPRDYLTYFKPKYNLTVSIEAYLAYVCPLYYKYFNTNPLFDDAILLAKKVSAQLPVALVTGGDTGSNEIFMKRSGLKDAFDVVLTNEMYKEVKPNPESDLIAAEKLGISPDKCVVIEDTGRGVEAAKNAGMKCIAIPNSYTEGHDFSKADIVVKSAKDITMEMIKSLG